MKAIVKATGEIVDVFECGTIFKHAGYDYMDAEGNSYKSTDLDFNDNTPLNYYDRLLHQYAGMAMQAILTNLGNTVDPDYIVQEAEAYATALVEKLKEERNG